MAAYYNEIDPQAAQWLRNLIAAGLIAPGDVDERSIKDVQPHELAGYTQCHFFAGIGVWSHALRAAGWSDDRPVWTGSCPCQPFSAAGKGEGLDDPRHLWPDWFRLIRECGPVVVFGEQVAGPDGVAWLDLAQADLEEHSHTVGAVVTCSAGFGGPDIRQRLYWVADAEDRDGRGELEAGGAWRGWPRLAGSGPAHRLADPDGERLEGLGLQLLERGSRAAVPETTGRSEAGGMALAHGERGCGGTAGGEDAADARLPGEARGLADADGGLEGDGGLQRSREHGLKPQDGDAPCRLADTGHAERRPRDRARDASGQHLLRQDREEGSTEPRERGEDGRPGPLNGFWRAADWLLCTDGKWRPVEPGTFPLDTGIAGRLVRLRAYGNALNAQAATEFIRAYLEVKTPLIAGNN